MYSHMINLLMLKKKINITGFLLLFFPVLGCSDQQTIEGYTYKGLGIFCYFEIDSGSYYDMVFIPFHLKENSGNPEEISRRKILEHPENIIFERGLGFGTFRHKDIFDEIFLHSEPCEETKKYCFVYVNFEENKQTETEKWNYYKKDFSIRICLNNRMKIVKYDHTKNAARDLIRISALKIVK